VRNVSVTAGCGVCGGPVPAGRARRWCSDACRQAAFRARRAAPAPVQPARSDTVYECPDCEARYIGSQRCEACNRWCRRLGPGGPCPHCLLTELPAPQRAAREVRPWFSPSTV
jgi:hypothetical protein